MSGVNLIGRRGQGAMEYLMTYSWTIVVVMVVGIVMWQLGVFSFQGQTSTTSTGFPRLRPQLPLIAVNGSGYWEGTFTNGAGGSIQVNSVSCGGNPISKPENIVAYGENFNVNGSCGITGTTGNPYHLEITISYNTTIAGRTVAHTDQGTLRGPIK